MPPIVMVHWFGLPTTGVQLDDHPAKVEPPLGVAVNVTVEPRTKLAVHLPLVQLIPDGLLVTVPSPDPNSNTVNEGVDIVPALPFSVTVALAVIVFPLAEVPMAVMAEVPWPTPVASPEESTVATSASLDIHVTNALMSRVVGLVLNVPMARNCTVSPVEFNVWVIGIIVRLVRSPDGGEGCATLTVIVVVPTTCDPLAPVAVAVMTVLQELVGQAIAVTSPDALTLATPGLLDPQLTSFVIT